MYIMFHNMKFNSKKLMKNDKICYNIQCTKCNFTQHALEEILIYVSQSNKNTIILVTECSKM